MRRRAFSIIDIVFAVLFVSVLILVGMKFMITGEKQYQKSREATAFDLACSNLFEELYAEPEEDGVYQRFIDENGKEVASYEEADYLLIYTVSEYMEKLKEIAVTILDRDGRVIYKTVSTKHYIGGR